jgi:hypothetical protein
MKLEDGCPKQRKLGPPHLKVPHVSRRTGKPQQPKGAGMNMNELVGTAIVGGHIRVFEQDNPSNILFSEKNVIVLNTKFLFARLMADSKEPLYGVWGLAVGAGAPDWPANNQPDALPTQQQIITPIIRKAVRWKRFVDSNLNQIANEGKSNVVDFQTILNATTDNIGTPIRELGLIGGGTTGSDLSIAPPFNSSTQNGINTTNSAILINYTTLPPLKLPEGINFIFSWVLTF